VVSSGRGVKGVEAGGVVAGPPAGGAACGGAARGNDAFSGSPSSRCRAAQVKQAPRQPNCASSNADSGQPTVLAKPAISVMPVMALRESCPYSRTSVANAAS
jgi:hypothetical protein